MAMSQAEKARSHQRIVQSTARLIREQGIAATGVSEAMKAAGLTHGGFYKHFPDKEALVVEALEQAFAQMLGQLGARFAHQTPNQALASYRRDYASQAHIDHPGEGCPIAALGGDVSRASADLKAMFGKGVQATVEYLADSESGSKPERRAAAARELAMLAGAVMIARAADPETARLFQNAVLRETN